MVVMEEKKGERWRDERRAAGCGLKSICYDGSGLSGCKLEFDQIVVKGVCVCVHVHVCVRACRCVCV